MSRSMLFAAAVALTVLAGSVSPIMASTNWDGAGFPSSDTRGNWDGSGFPPEGHNWDGSGFPPEGHNWDGAGFPPEGHNWDGAGFPSSDTRGN